MSNAKPANQLLSLLQLVSPALPVGAYSYSEGIETLVQSGQISTAAALEQWLRDELNHGAVRLEAAVLVRLYRSAQAADVPQLERWNQWLSAFRETAELREQSWQMGWSLRRLLQELQPENHLLQACDPCNFATAFAAAAAGWQIELELATLGYLQSWATNLINAGLRLGMLGQTQGQRILLNLQPSLEQTQAVALRLTDEQLDCCSWGASIASMQHETLYSRLFRS